MKEVLVVLPFCHFSAFDVKSRWNTLSSFKSDTRTGAAKSAIPYEMLKADELKFFPPCHASV